MNGTAVFNLQHFTFVNVHFLDTRLDGRHNLSRGGQVHNQQTRAVLKWFLLVPTSCTRRVAGPRASWSIEKKSLNTGPRSFCDGTLALGKVANRQVS
ncbi:hypothetical protein PISMIDRAFT_604816 [Pisolithus microcarpus 441]|uniref:Uncharacterized protein n=1 Tax=Pisolithus microcarpus 441 TaxID=765257 RepID=A0A0D0A100_9AGAM|nr:hypothetical protein PISMIDRAFT_604816 [Pisolithus microcarpus 441]